MLLLASTVAFAAEPEYHLELTSQIMPETVAADLRARMDGEEDAYVAVNTRIDPMGTWVGRAGIGVDLLGGGDGLDLRLGLFLGGTGDLTDRSMMGRPAAGVEILFSVTVGRVYGWYHHVDGFAGPLEDRLSEDEVRLGFRINDKFRVHGQYLTYNPGDDRPRGGAGLGAEVVF